MQLALLICLSLLPLIRADFFDECSDDLRDHIEATAIAEAAKVVRPHVYFSAKLSGQYKPFPHQAVKYDVVVSNIGDGYNSTTGYFTSPVEGTFQFSVQSCSNPTYENVLAIMQNGTMITSINSKDAHCAYTAVPTYVTVGQDVWVERINGSATEYEYGDVYWCGFTGVLLS